MRNRTTLTKSLHTVTVVTRVALLLTARPSGSGMTAEEATAAALYALGFDSFAEQVPLASTDPTVCRCIAAVRAELDKAAARALRAVA